MIILALCILIRIVRFRAVSMWTLAPTLTLTLNKGQARYFNIPNKHMGFNHDPAEFLLIGTNRVPVEVKAIDQFLFFIYLGFYIAFNTVQVISQRVVGRAEETNTYSWSMFCTVNCRPMASNYQLSHLRLGREPNPGLRGGR